MAKRPKRQPTRIQQPIAMPKRAKARGIGLLENMARTGPRYVVSQRVRGGIEFEFASELKHEDFADKLAEAVGVDRETMFVSSSYVDSSSDKDYKVWRVECDNSIETDTKHTYKIEVVAPVMSVADLLKVTPNVLALIEKHGKTNSLTGMHTTLSVPGKKLVKDLDVVKLIVLLNEQYYGEEFGRMDAYYAKLQVPRLIERVKNAHQYPTLRDTIEHFITKPYHVNDNVLPVEKRTSLNLSKVAKHNLVEFRLPGGANYQKKWPLIRRMVVHFAAALAASCNEQAYLKDYVKQLLRLIEDAKPSPRDPLASKKGGSGSGIRLQWLKKTIDGAVQWSLVDVTDGPVEKTREWAERHLVLKIVSRFNAETKTYDALGVGDGSGWNPSLVDNITGGSGDRRLERLRKHVIRNRHPYVRQAVKPRKKDAHATGFWSSDRTPADYYDAVVRRLLDPTSNLSIPANHMARSYLGVDITPMLAERLLSNANMVPYVSWYFTDLALNKRVKDLPSQLAYRVARQPVAPAAELAELAAAYVSLGIQVPRLLLIRTCREHSVVEFTKFTYALIKKHKLLDKPSAKVLVEYLVLLSKYPSRRVEFLKSYQDLYASKSKDRQQVEWRPPEVVKPTARKPNAPKPTPSKSTPKPVSRRPELPRSTRIR
jgi:hypothetical protein